MKKFSFVLLSVFQLSSAFIMLTVYFIYALAGVNEMQMGNENSLLLFNLYQACFFTGITTSVCAIAGLPVRLVPEIKKWRSKGLKIEKQSLIFFCLLPDDF